jgi:hypothetical protein
MRRVVNRIGEWGQALRLARRAASIGAYVATLASAGRIVQRRTMRKILRIGLFLCAAGLVAPQRASASAEHHAELRTGWRASNTDGELPLDVGRRYGFMLMVLVMPTAVLGWGVARIARERARSEV